MNWGVNEKVVTPRPVSRGILSLLENGGAARLAAVVGMIATVVVGCMGAAVEPAAEAEVTWEVVTAVGVVVVVVVVFTATEEDEGMVGGTVGVVAGIGVHVEVEDLAAAAVVVVIVVVRAAVVVVLVARVEVEVRVVVAVVMRAVVDGVLVGVDVAVVDGVHELHSTGHAARTLSPVSGSTQAGVSCAAHAAVSPTPLHSPVVVVTVDVDVGCGVGGGLYPQQQHEGSVEPAPLHRSFWQSACSSYLYCWLAPEM